MVYIAIREQLALLVLLCCLVSLAVISVAIWITNYNFVTGVSSGALSLAASLYAQQLSSNALLLQSSVQSITTRVLVQSALVRYEQGNNTASNWGRAVSDLSTALQGGGSSSYLLQIQVAPNNDTGLNGPYSLMNTTGATAPTIRFPYNNANGTPIYLGDANGYPPNLYPNLTYFQTPVNSTYSSSRAAFNGQEITNDRPLLLGPWQINSSFALCSLTLPIHNNNATDDTLGFMTVVADASLIYSVEASTLGIGDTGLVLIVGPRNRTNRFPESISQIQAEDPTALGNQLMHFVLSPPQNGSRGGRHSEFDHDSNYTFPLHQFPAVLKAVTNNDSTAQHAGALLDTYNEQGVHVATGYASSGSRVADWVIIVEQAFDEVYQPITNLRNLLVACLFGTIGVILLCLFPVAHYSVRPIRRLREATRRSVDPYAFSCDGSSSRSRSRGRPRNGSPASEPADEEAAQQNELARKEGFVTRVSRWPFRKRQRRRTEREVGERTFRIPGKVRDGKHIIHDELTDLTGTFNEMSEELMMQYARLEEKVRERTHELELSKKAAEAANEAKTMFIANISHELKTPLNGILGMCAVCMGEEDPAKVKRSLSIIYKSGDLLLNLLNDLLTFSKNQIGQQLSLDEREFKLAEVSSQILSIFDKQAREAAITLKVNFEGPNESLETASGTPGSPGYGPFGTGRVKDMVLWGDQHRILQVLINLVSNSLKFTPRGGAVTVALRCIGEGELELERANSHSRKSSLTSQQSRTSKASRASTNALRNIRSKVMGSSSRASNHTTNSTSPRAAGPASVSNSIGGAMEQSDDMLQVPTSALGHTLTHTVTNHQNIHTALEINSRDAVKNLPPLQPIRTDQRADSPALLNARVLRFEFVVTDTGPGIPLEQQQKVFEPFVQGDLGLSKRYGGTGLGLSICSQLATLMRGEMTLSSLEGEGSTFCMRLPLRFVKEVADSLNSPSIDNSARNSIATVDLMDESKSPRRAQFNVEHPPKASSGNAGPNASQSSLESFEAAHKPRLVGLSQPFFAASPPLETPKAQMAAVQRAAKEASRNGRKARVLVAEDNKVNQEVVLRMLKLEDIYDVTVAKDGQEAFDLVRDTMDTPEKFDLVFMDIQMPNLDGLQSTRQIRAMGFSAPIVALTAFAEESNVQECMDSGMNFFLPKPIRRPALKQVLKRYCPTIPEEDGDGAGASKSRSKGKKADLTKLSTLTPISSNKSTQASASANTPTSQSLRAKEASNSVTANESPATKTDAPSAGAASTTAPKTVPDFSAAGSSAAAPATSATASAVPPATSTSTATPPVSSAPPPTSSAATDTLSTAARPRPAGSGTVLDQPTVASPLTNGIRTAPGEEHRSPMDADPASQPSSGGGTVRSTDSASSEINGDPSGTAATTPDPVPHVSGFIMSSEKPPPRP